MPITRREAILAAARMCGSPQSSPHVERSDRADGGPLAYRVLHRVTPWKPGTAPRLTRSTLEGTPPLGL